MGFFDSLFSIGSPVPTRSYTPGEERAAGLLALQDFYKASGLADKYVTFQDVVDRYDADHPKFIGAMGGAILQDFNVSDSTARVHNAMVDVAIATAAQPTAVIPDFNSFFDSLKGSRLQVTFSDVKDVATETAKQVASVAVGGLAVYGLVAAAGVLLFFYESAPRNSK